VSCCGDGQTAYCSKIPCGCRKLREKLERPPSFMGWAYARVMTDNTRCGHRRPLLGHSLWRCERERGHSGLHFAQRGQDVSSWDDLGEDPYA